MTSKLIINITEDDMNDLCRLVVGMGKVESEIIVRNILRALSQKISFVTTIFRDEEV